MSQIPSDPDINNSRRRSVDYDELIAVFVAFLTLGSVLFWGLTRSGVNLFGNVGLFNPDSAPSLIGDLDGAARLESANDDSDIAAAEQDGFGTGNALGAAGASNILGDVGESLKEATEIVPTSPSVPSQVTSIPAQPVPVPPQQSAQPAQQPESGDNVAATPATIEAPLEASREALRFQDVPDDYWAKPYIDALSERLVIDGLSEDTFAPDQPVTRAQLASAIAQAFPSDEQEDAIAFSDVDADYWAIEAIDKAVQRGFMNGFPDETFQPGLPIPRAQVLTALVTGINSATPEDAQGIVARYADAAEIPSWAIGKMAAATQATIVVNHPSLDSLAPNEPATRAEVAAMIYQALAAQGRVDAIDGEYVVKP
ncbi:MAG: S-layer homology domain-containing protein [Cyanobacteria bacterium P01_H01_bin.105]